MNFDWSTVIPTVISFVLGGGIMGFINARATKKKAMAEANMADAQAEGVDISNAKEIIDMYRAGIKDLNEMHEKQLADAEAKYNSLKDQLNERITTLSNKLDQMEKENSDIRRKYNELLRMLAGVCATCGYFDSCIKRSDLGIKK